MPQNMQLGQAGKWLVENYDTLLRQTRGLMMKKYQSCLKVTEPDDVMSETCTRFLNKMQSGDFVPDDPRAYFTGIRNNVLLEAVGKYGKSRKETQYDENPEVETYHVAITGRSKELQPDDALVNHENRAEFWQCVSECLKKIKPIKVLCWQYSEIDHFTQSEVGLIFGLKQSTVSEHIQYTNKYIRDHITKKMPDLAREFRGGVK